MDNLLLFTLDTLLVESYQKVFQNQEVKIISVANIDHARRYLREHPVAVLVFDFGQEEEVQYLAELSSLQPMMVIAMTSCMDEHHEVSVRMLCLQNGATVFLSKTPQHGEFILQSVVLLHCYHQFQQLKCWGNILLIVNDLQMDTAKRKVCRQGREITLSPKEYELLGCLMRNVNNVMGYKVLYETVWKESYLDDNTTIFYHIGSLRRKLGAPDLIESVYGVGYRLREE